MKKKNEQIEAVIAELTQNFIGQVAISVLTQYKPEEVGPFMAGVSTATQFFIQLVRVALENQGQLDFENMTMDEFNEFMKQQIHTPKEDLDGNKHS